MTSCPPLLIISCARSISGFRFFITSVTQFTLALFFIAEAPKSHMFHETNVCTSAKSVPRRRNSMTMMDMVFFSNFIVRYPID